MSARVDVFVKAAAGQGDYGSGWRCYVQSVLPSAARRMVAALESEGEQVLLTTSSKVLGRFVYQTPDAERAS